MGQHWVIVNLDKKECVIPHKMGSGAKLTEQLGTFPGTAQALLILCAAQPFARGGGDLKTGYPGAETIGRWAGDRIAVVGDYAEDTDLAPEFKASEIYASCREGIYTDVTEAVCKVIEIELEGKFVWNGKSWDFYYNDELPI
jgi:hypothetical protein